MPVSKSSIAFSVLAIATLLFAPLTNAMGDHNPPLRSWANGASTQRIVEFVDRVTDVESPDYLPPAERVAVFDNDGTLWAEQPAYFQVLFAADVARERLREDPELAEDPAYKTFSEGGLKAVAAGGHEALFQLVFASHTGVSNADFQQSVRRWLDSARHPKTEKRYDAMVYQPMLELLHYLREHEFSTWIVSGGGVSFMRVWTEEVYGIPPQQVIGSRVHMRYEETGDGPRLMREAAISHVNDGPGKPVGIQQVIGKRPVLAVGNSDGDFEMLRWTTASSPSLGVLIHHTDDEREWAYDRDSAIGHLERGLDEAPARGWVVVDMKADWKQVFSP